MPHVTIRDRRLVPSPDVTRAGRMDTMVIYGLDTAPAPRVAIVPGDAPTDAQIEAAIRAEESKRGGSLGRTFKL